MDVAFSLPEDLARKLQERWGDLSRRALESLVAQAYREAIVLAAREEADLLLIDKRAGRAVARQFGVTVTGTIGVLGAAAQKGLIDPVRAVQDLRDTSFRASADLYRWLLEKQN